MRILKTLVSIAGLVAMNHTLIEWLIWRSYYGVQVLGHTDVLPEFMFVATFIISVNLGVIAIITRPKEETYHECIN